MPKPRKPQINFQVEPPLKMLYEEAKVNGHFVARLCAAGLLLMVEDPRARRRALERLRGWEQQYEHANPRQIRAFVAELEDALAGAAPASRPARATRPGRARAKRTES